MSRPVERFLHIGLDLKLFVCIWLGLVCASWSRARRNTSGKPGFPAPLRSREHLWGLAGLSDRDRERVSVGNRQARWAARLFARSAAAGVPMVVENPLSSLLWLTAPFKRLLRLHSSFVVHYCRYGTSWRKPTLLLACHLDLSELSVLCHGRGVCCFTNSRHQQLTGRSPDGRMWSAIASAYPMPLCTKTMECLERATRCGNKIDPPSHPSAVSGNWLATSALK